MPLLKEQCRAARGLLNWSQADLAEASGVSLATIKHNEPGLGPLDARESTIDKLRAALEAAGIEFIDANGGGPGVRLREPIG